MFGKGVLPLSFALLLSLTAEASAQQDDPAMRSAGRKLAMDGIALFQQGKPEQASAKLEKAYQLLQVPSVALWSARALEKRGLLVEASERYVEATRLKDFKGDQEVQVQAQRDAARELEALTARLPSLVIAVPDAGAQTPVVSLDGKPVPAALLGEEQPVNPGKHELKVTLGSRQTTRQLKLAEAEKKTETVRFDESSPGPGGTSPSTTDQPASKTTPDTADAAQPGHTSSTRWTLGFVALGAGGAGLVVGSVTGLMAMSKRSALEGKRGVCTADVCLPSQRDEVSSLDTLRTVSTAGFIAGGVLASVGVVLLVTGKSEQQSAQARPRLALEVGGSWLGLSGSFR